MESAGLYIDLKADFFLLKALVLVVPVLVDNE